MLTDLVSFLTSGGLLALVQAVLSYLASRKAETQGATSNANQTGAAVANKVSQAAQIDNAIAVESDADVVAELRKDYSRD